MSFPDFITGLKWQDFALGLAVLLAFINIYYARKRTKIAEVEHEWARQKYERKQKGGSHIEAD